MGKDKTTNFTGSIIIFFVALFLYSKFGPAFPLNLTTQSRGEPLVVSAEGKVVVTPDVAKVTLGIEENGLSLKQVQDSVNKKSKTLTGELKKLGIDEKNIKTTSYNVYPNYDYTNPAQKITGYRVSVNYEVKVEDFDKINEVVVIGTRVGANSVSNIMFEVNDKVKKDKLQEAREMAVKEAKEKAEGLAKASGIILGRVVNVSETSNSSVTPIAMMDKSAVGVGGVPETADITPGETEIKVTISLSYEIR